MTEPLGRTAAYAFVADVLRKTGKESEWSSYFTPYFHRHLKTLKDVGLMDELLRLSSRRTTKKSELKPPREKEKKKEWNEHHFTI